MEELSQLVVIGFMLFIPAIAVAGLLWMMREKLSARREMSAKKSMPRPK